MTIKDFAEMSGVTVFRCGPEWGGTWAYKLKDSPNMSVNGFKTEDAVYKRWARETFGETTLKALMKLLRKAP